MPFVRPRTQSVEVGFSNMTLVSEETVDMDGISESRESSESSESDASSHDSNDSSHDNSYCSDDDSDESNNNSDDSDDNENDDGFDADLSDSSNDLGVESSESEDDFETAYPQPRDPQKWKDRAASWQKRAAGYKTNANRKGHHAALCVRDIQFARSRCLASSKKFIDNMNDMGQRFTDLQRHDEREYSRCMDKAARCEREACLRELESAEMRVLQVERKCRETNYAKERAQRRFEVCIAQKEEREMMAGKTKVRRGMHGRIEGYAWM